MNQHTTSGSVFMTVLNKTDDTRQFSVPRTGLGTGLGTGEGSDNRPTLFGTLVPKPCRVKPLRTSPQVLSMSLWIIKLNVLSLPFFFLFGNPTNKTLTGTAYTSIKPPGPITVINQSENTESQSGPIYYTLFFGGAQLCCTIYLPRQGARIWCRKKPIS
jgi:hypothetical protein